MFNPFDDHHAVKFVNALVKQKSPARVKQTLDKAAKQAKKSWLDNSKICEEALAAATVIAVAHGQAGKIPVPDEVTGWIVKTGYTPSDSEVALAGELVETIRTNSMLQEIADDVSWTEWKRGCLALGKRLGKPAKSVKAPPAAKAAAEMSPTAARKALEKKRGEFETIDGKLVFRCWSEKALTDKEIELLACIPELCSVYIGEQAITDDSLRHLARLPKLESLLLSENSIGPAGLEHLLAIKNLRELAIRKTATDAMLEVIGRMSNLRSLDIYNSQKVTDKGLRALGGLKKLEELNIGYAKSDGSGLAVIPATKLKILDIKGLQLNDAGSRALGRFTALQELDCGSCRIPMKAFAEVTKLKKLQKLSLYDVSGLTDDVFQHLAKLSALRTITFYCAKKLTGKGLGALTALKKLEELELNSTGIKGPEVGSLGELPKLRALDLNNTAVGDECIEGLSKSKSIAVLNLRDTKVTDAGVAQLATMKSLRELDLTSVKLTDAAAEPLMTMTWLEDLSILFTGISPQVAGKVRRTLKKTSVGIDP